MRRQNHQNREGDLLNVLATNRQAGRIINKEVDLIIVQASRHQAGLNINREGDRLTVLAISHQAGRVTNKEGDLITELASHHQAGQDINKEGNLIIVLASHHQAGHNTDREGDLPTVLPSHRQEGEVTDKEVALLVGTRALEAEDTTDPQVAECGEDHQDPVTETPHSKINPNTVYDVGIPILVWSAPTMLSIEDPRVVFVTYNTQQRVTRNRGAGPLAETTNRWVA